MGVIDLEEHTSGGGDLAAASPELVGANAGDLEPSEESTSEEDSSSSESSLAEPAPVTPPPFERVHEPGQFFINMTSLVLHEAKTASSFKRGRKITASYTAEPVTLLEVQV